MFLLRQLHWVTLALLGLSATPAYGFTASLDSIDPGAMDITSYVDSGSTPPSGTVLTVFDGSANAFGSTYTAVYNVDASPAAVVVTAGELDQWSYDATAGQVTIQFEHTGFVEGAADFGPTDPFAIALIPADDTAVSGPPSALTGMAMSTNLLEWSLIPPSADHPYFGFDFSGPAGSEAFIRLFIPDTGIDLLSSLAGKELTVDDLAVFLNDDQASMSITEVDTGIEVFVYIKFSDDKVAIIPADSEVSKSVTIREQANVSLTANKKTVAKGDRTKLFGWIKHAKADQTIVIKRKQAGESGYTEIDRVKTNSDGYYKSTIKVNKTANYIVTYKTHKSKKLTVTVND